MKTIFTMIFLFTIVLANAQCGQPVVDSRNNKSYNTVQIGTQCWMAENINVGSRIQGTLEQTDNSIIEKYCYNNLEDNCTIRGGLYQWNEMMQYTTVEGSQGICPTGWHIPTSTEYLTLVNYLGGMSVAGGKIKSTNPTGFIGPYSQWVFNVGATNSSGFSALPGGLRWSNHAFYFMGEDFDFWLSSMPSPDSRNPTQPAFYGGATWCTTWAWASDAQFYKMEGLSVRCIQNQEKKK